MLPGATLIVVCPHCHAPHRLATPRNDDAAESWSYPKGCAPLWQSQRPLAKCAACGKFCWVDEMPWVGHWEPWGKVLIREPLSFDVVITSAWDDLDLVARNLASRLHCSVLQAARWLRKLPAAVAKDMPRVEAEVLAEYYWELGVSAETSPCRVDLESPPKEWFTAPPLAFATQNEYRKAHRSLDWHTHGPR